MRFSADEEGRHAEARWRPPPQTSRDGGSGEKTRPVGGETGRAGCTMMAEGSGCCSILNAETEVAPSISTTLVVYHESEQHIETRPPVLGGYFYGR